MADDLSAKARALAEAVTRDRYYSDKTYGAARALLAALDAEPTAASEECWIGGVSKTTAPTVPDPALSREPTDEEVARELAKMWALPKFADHGGYRPKDVEDAAREAIAAVNAARERARGATDDR